MNLSEEDIEFCKQQFNQLDDLGEGTIRADDLDIALELVNCKQNFKQVNKYISEIDENNTGKIKFQDFLMLYQKLKYASLQDDDQDMIDAFVAMGGGENDDSTAGHVDAEKLIQIIKNEFQMTIDIERLIEEIDTDHSGKIEFGEFKDLLKTNYLEEKDEDK